MSVYDDLLAAVSPPDANVDLARIAAALTTARATEGQPLPEQYWLPDYPGQTSELKVDGVLVGAHGLVAGAGREMYEATIDVDGRALPLFVRRHSIWRRSGDERRDTASFGPGHLVGGYVVHCRSRPQVAAFLTDPLAARLVGVGHDLVSISLAPREGRTVVKVRVAVASSKEAAPAIALARAAYQSAAVVAPKGFVASGAGRALDDEDVVRLVKRVRDATRFLAGDVERVGDGVEARLELDAPAELEARLRVEVVDGGVRVLFRGALPIAPARAVKLTPEVGLWKKALGLVDPKLGDDKLDHAFLIEGDVDTARLVLTDKSAALRLAGRGATLSAGEEGVGVVVDPIPAEDEAVLDVVVACIACWKETALACAGFRSGEPAD